MNYSFNTDGHDGHAAITRCDPPSEGGTAFDTVDLVDGDLLVSDIDLSVSVNDDETLDEIFDGVQLQLSRYHIPREGAGEWDYIGAHSLRLKTLVSWSDVARLHAFLGFLLEQRARV